MIPESLKVCENELRRAVGRQQFGPANTLIASYCRLAEIEAAALPADHPDKLDIFTRVADVLEWTRLVIYSARASWADELSRLPMVSAYLDSAPNDPSGLRFDF